MTARSVRQILKGVSASLQGKTRGPDHDPEGKRRTPHRDSYDVDDARAKPWRPIGDGSVGQGIAHREALIQTAKELFQHLWREYPLAEIRQARQRHAALSAELDQYVAGAEAAPGRPALLRQELGKVSSYLLAADGRLRRIDITVLEALLQTIDFATGRLFPAIETIAARAGCHRNSVIAALQRLRDHGFIAWVRRTVKTANEGEFAPQREQTSNAYYFEHRAKMTGRVFQRYCQLLVVKLRRLGKVPNAITNRGPREPRDPALRQALAALAELTNKTLKGDMSKLGNLFEDAQVQQGLRPLIANMEEYRRIRAAALAAGGTTDRDFAERMKDSAEQTRRLQVSGTALAVTLGAKLLPTVNAVLERANAFTDRVTKWTAANPGLARSLAVGAAAFAALFLVLGGGAILIAGLAAPFAALAATASLIGVGMLPLIGIVGGVALVAAVYAIYANWGAISTWFAGLWESIKSATWSAIQFVGRVLLSFSPVGLMIQGFMALLAWMRGPLGQRMIAAGGDIVRGIITGITGMLGRLKDTIVGAASAAASWFKSKLGIHSPSRVFASFGGFMMQGLDQGLARDQDRPVDRIDGLTSRLANAVATGTAALAIGAGSAAPAAARPSAAPAALGPVTIVIQQLPGQSERDLARAVRAELERLTRVGAGRRTSMADRPDGDDL
ncbi:phage tail tape measure protein [Sphingomonas sp. ABOLD]|uniref:Phage tail tape measure protein n=1 Tax=Sphingomonas trueperi TaxID=53317 RepID=A0A7X5XXP8_9SPHN|nr:MULTISPECIES: phage tail tape measure protein [Sphingomonas]NJB97283.1 hypothetical protein [Sphingomonas trueperi]RSV50612.1 phage tail tape measure protein [Sphingomonas sp. ABOLD]